MLNKFHWGWRVTAFYTGFVIFMLFMVYQSTQMKTELVTADYYGKELKYQQQLDKIKRANQLSEPLYWNVEKNTVQLSFPKDVKGKKVNAEVTFYRPDNVARDFNVNCQADSMGVCIIKSEKFHHGAYQMQIDWSDGNATYYKEGTININ